jgi:hypothetical protein
VNTIGANEDVRSMGRTIREPQRDFRTGFLELLEAVPEMDAGLVYACGEDAHEVGTVKYQEWRAVSGWGTSPVGIEDFFARVHVASEDPFANGGGGEERVVIYTDPCQSLNRLRAYVYTGTDFPECWRLLEEFGVKAKLRERMGSGQSSHPATDNRDIQSHDYVRARYVSRLT